MSRRIAPHLGLLALSALASIGLGCGSTGGCAGLKPLPKNPAPFGLPKEQVIEGGAQLRLTKQGLDKIEKLIPGLISGMLMDSGTCAIQHKKWSTDIGITTIDWFEVCGDNTCPGSAPGCGAFFYLNSKDLPNDLTPPLPKPPGGKDDGKLGVTVSVSQASPTSPVRFTIRVKMDIAVPIALNVFGTGSCTILARTGHAVDRNTSPLDFQATVDLGTDPVTGELTLNLSSGNAIVINNAGGLGVDGQGGACAAADILDVATDFIDTALSSFIGTFLINNIFKGAINDLIQSFLPKPLGIAGTVNPGTFLASFQPPPDTNLEMFVVPGGYVQSTTGGLTIGVLTGMNSDTDQTTRDVTNVSEPSKCVPLRGTPVLSQAPWSLPVNPTTTNYHLAPADQFAGMPDPVDAMGTPRDVAIGLSRTFLDLAGFHVYNSGTLCLVVDGTALPQLNAGTLAVIVGSLGAIAEVKTAPLMLVLRPQQPPTFKIGEGTMTDPLLNVQLTDMRIDFYAWIEERFVRIFTLAIDMNLGLNMTVTKNAAGKPAIQPTLVGLDAANVKITVLNTDLLGESPTDLAAVFPSLINIAASAAGGAIPAVELPGFGGFALSDFELGKVHTTEDDFLGIFASLDTSGLKPRFDWSDPQHPKRAGDLETEAHVKRISVPRAADLRAQLKTGKIPARGSSLRPSVVVATSATGQNGRPVEVAYRVDGGLWHPWQTAPDITVEDDAFFLQGKHTIEVRSRAAGDYTSEDMTPARLEVVIDSQPPDVKGKPVAEGLAAEGFDLVTPAAELVYAWTLPGKPATDWSSSLTVAKSTLDDLAARGVEKILLLAKDGTGNIGETPVDLTTLESFHGRETSSKSGCGSCAATGSGPLDVGLGNLALCGLVALSILGRRRRAPVLLLGACLVASACDSSNTCRVDDDCSKKQCDPGQIARCQASKCVCQIDVTLGNGGRFASMAIIGNQAYVAAYNESYGDLMIGHVRPPGRVDNWQFVDGVPNDPPDTPISRHRGGVSGNGVDVGRYTSIAETKWGDPIIAYFDRTNAQLKFASFNAIAWKSHVVDAPGAEGAGADDVGRWAAMSLDKNGIPSIAYVAMVKAGMDGMPESQLRWAQAKTAQPEKTSDWTVTIIDRRAVPMAAPTDMGTTAAPDPLLPESIAVMLAVSRKKDDSPGIVYYDRVKGNLRLIEWNATEKAWGIPEILDGENEDGSDSGDVGQYPSMRYDDGGIGHISYVDASRDNLMYIDTINRTRVIVDDGYRPMEEMTADGIPSPVWHLVGDSSSIDLVGTHPLIAYQDSTAVQCRFAQNNDDGTWTTKSLGGHEMPFKGAYGFYNTLRVDGVHAVVATYVINQQHIPEDYFVDVLDVDLGLVQ